MTPDFVEQGHLGGYIEGGDEATFYPDLWSFLIKQYDIRSVVDVGCGEGQSVDFFVGLGCDVLGIEGIPQQNEQIVLHDFTEGPFPDLGPFDLAWCCEFVEHVEERYVPNFLPALASAKMVLMTHAEPGQAGYHHVNCRSADYWIGAMAAVGKQYDAGLTALTRGVAAANLSPWNHYAQRGLAFV